MNLTPQITLTVNLLDYSGNQIGSATQPAYVRVALCGYGQMIPRIPGTGMMGKVVSWQTNILYVGAQISILLWGNDVITPSNTYYDIAILDANKNVIQSGAYQFTGSGTLDLSQQSPFTPATPTTPTVIGGVVIEPYSASPVFNCYTLGILTFEMTLTGNVTGPTLTNTVAGTIITFALIQDSTGSRTFTWPSQCKNAAAIRNTANSRTVQSFYVASNGNLYPLSGGTYN